MTDGSSNRVTDGGSPDAGTDGGSPDARTDGGSPDARTDGGSSGAKTDGGSSGARTDGGTRTRSSTLDRTGSRDALIGGASDRYHRALDAVVALGVLGLALGLLSLVDVLAPTASGGDLAASMSGLLLAIAGGAGLVAAFVHLDLAPAPPVRVRGVGVALVVDAAAIALATAVADLTLATVLGGILVVLAAATAGGGTLSRTGTVDTHPARTAGLLAAAGFFAIGVLLGGAAWGSLVGFGAAISLVVVIPLWLASGLVTGVALAAIAALPREDVGSTLPAAIVVGAMGLPVVAGAIGVGWQWNPTTISGGFTGGVVVPLFAVFGSLFAAWAAGKARAGFGARGREYGAFVLIGLTAFTTVVVMVSIVAFVAVKGVGYALHGLTVPAGTALVLLAPLALVAGRIARPVADDAVDAPERVLGLVPTFVVGALGALLVWVLATGSPLRHEYTYTVYEERSPVALDTAVAVTPDLAVDPTLLVVAALACVGLLWNRRESNPGRRRDAVLLGRRATTALGASCLFLAALIVALGPSPAGVSLATTLGAAAAAVTGVVAGLLGLLPLAAALVAWRSSGGERVDASANETSANGGIWNGEGGNDGIEDGGIAVDVLGPRRSGSRDLVAFGVGGGLGLLAAAIVLEWLAGVAVGPGSASITQLAALAGTLGGLGAGVVATLAGRTGSSGASTTASPSTPGDGPTPVDGPSDGLLREDDVPALAWIAAAGFPLLLGLDVLLASGSFVLGPVSVVDGALEWPMAFTASIPLGTDPGGVLPAIVGTVWLVVGATLFAVPLGVGAAIFLSEYAESGSATAVVEVATNALWSTPSVVFGLFGAAFLIPRLGGDESLLAGMLVLGFMLLPLVVITSWEAIKAVPDGYRDASAALGVNRWQTIRSVVLPAAFPGVITGIVLGVGRVAGETAPLILVLGSTLNPSSSVDVLGGFRFVADPPFVANGALTSASASLPTQIWAIVAAGVSGSPARGWATAFLLLAVVLTFYGVGVAARAYFRRKLSYDQQ